jgi:hypothetical protein
MRRRILEYETEQREEANAARDKKDKPDKMLLTVMIGYDIF